MVTRLASWVELSWTGRCDHSKSSTGQKIASFLKFRTCSELHDWHQTGVFFVQLSWVWLGDVWTRLNAFSVGRLSLWLLVSLCLCNLCANMSAYLIGSIFVSVVMTLWVEQRTSDWGVAGSTLTRTVLCKNFRQVVHVRVPLSPSSITWYQPRASDALSAGKVIVSLAESNGSLPLGLRLSHQ